MMQPASELNRLRQAFAHCPDRGSAEGLPAPERIWNAVRGEAGPEEVAALADVAITHPEVAQEWGLARQLSRAGREARTVSTWRRRFAPVLAVAAVLVLALVPLLWRQTTGHDPVYRGGDPPELRSEVVSQAGLSRHDFVLRWTDMGDDVVYTVTVTTADLEMVAQADGLTRPELRVSEEALIAIGEAERVLWRVEAVTGDGRALASKTFLQAVR